jgi:polyisoprenoid-binding protein YceI
LEIVSGTKTTGDKYDIKGRLTIKGITKDITFPATVKVTDKNFVAIAKVKIDRTQYDIRYGSASFFEGLGDKAISNDFELDVNIAATR